jgi:predicted nuclease with TOPRIM domain
MVDNSFPSLTGEESPREQARMLLDYMYILVEELKFQLTNLDTNNWNESALAGFQDDTTAEAEAQLARMAIQLAGVSGALGGLTNRVAELEGLSGRMSQAEENISRLEQSNEKLTGLTANHGEWIAELRTGLEELTEGVAALKQLLVPDGNGGCSLGAQGQDLHLVGNVYINGKLME